MLPVKCASRHKSEASGDDSLGGVVLDRDRDEIGAVHARDRRAGVGVGGGHGPQHRSGKLARLGKMRPILTLPITPRSASALPDMLRVAPSRDLADVVEQHWVVHWDRRKLPVLRRELLPDPSVNLVVEPGGVLLYGVGSAHGVRELCGQGMAIGTKFRPGGFSGFRPGPVSAITGRALTMSERVRPSRSAARRRPGSRTVGRGGDHPRGEQLPARPATGRRPAASARDGGSGSYAHRRTRRAGRRPGRPLCHCPAHDAAPVRRSRGHLPQAGFATAAPTAGDRPSQQRAGAARPARSSTRLLRPGAPGPRLPRHARPQPLGSIPPGAITTPEGSQATSPHRASEVLGRVAPDARVDLKAQPDLWSTNRERR
jgi:hypothetical protein